MEQKLDAFFQDVANLQRRIFEAREVVGGDSVLKILAQGIPQNYGQKQYAPPSTKSVHDAEDRHSKRRNKVNRGRPKGTPRLNIESTEDRQNKG